MAFFLNEQPPSPEKPDSGESPTSPSHSPKSAPLFKQEAGPVELVGKPHVSLSDYISRHLTDEKAETETVKAINFLNPVKPTKPPSEQAVAGQFLNSLDVELAAGLEQYLPTQIFRLRVMKKRLDGEIGELRGLLNKYSRLPNPSPDLKERTNAVRRRLRVLEHHEARVSWQLADSLPMGKLFYQFSLGGSIVSRTCARLLSGLWHGLARLVYGKSYLELEMAGAELLELEDVFRHRFSDKTAASNELGQLINRYEQTLVKAEKKAKNLSNFSFVRRLWQEAIGLLK